MTKYAGGEGRRSMFCSVIDVLKLLAVPTALGELLSFKLLLTLVASKSICTVCDVMEISHGGTLCYEKQTNT